MEIFQHMHGICSAEGELALPRAFLDRKLDKFVAWNSPFLKALSISEEEIRAINASEILSIHGEGVEINGGFRMIPCSSVPAMRAEHQVEGHVITTQGALTFVMLDVGTPGWEASKSSLKATVQEEQSRAYRFVHDRITPNLVAAGFLAESFAEKLETTQPEAAKKLKRSDGFLVMCLTKCIFFSLRLW